LTFLTTFTQNAHREPLFHLLRFGGELLMSTFGLPVTVNPPGASGLGSYRMGLYSGLTTGLSADDPVFGMRWTDSTNTCAIKYLRVRMAVITGFTAAQQLAFKARVARAWSVTDTGGTSVTLSTNNGKLRTANASTLFAAASVLIATTGTLTAGTRTLDAQAFLTGHGKTLAAAATVQDANIESVFDATGPNSDPIILVANEGIVITNTVAQGAAGTVVWSVDVAWSEHVSY
jgi:hypothetical protein